MAHRIVGPEATSPPGAAQAEPHVIHVRRNGEVRSAEPHGAVPSAAPRKGAIGGVQKTVIAVRRGASVARRMAPRRVVADTVVRRRATVATVALPSVAPIGVVRRRVAVIAVRRRATVATVALPSVAPIGVVRRRAAVIAVRPRPTAAIAVARVTAARRKVVLITVIRVATPIAVPDKAVRHRAPAVRAAMHREALRSKAIRRAAPPRPRCRRPSARRPRI